MKRIKKLYEDFKEFAVKGNMLDLAVGIIIGAAFNGIVSSLVEDIIMPPISTITGPVNFEQLKIVLEDEVVNAQGQVTQEMVAIRYGNFIQHLFEFLVIALVVFAIVRFANSLRRQADDPENKKVPTPKDILLLTEIRDLMKRQIDRDV